MNKAFSNFNWQNYPSMNTPLNQLNLNKVNDGLNTVDDRVVAMDTSKANQSDLLLGIKTVAYNTTTGVWTFTHFDGTKNTFDQNIEKIPVSFSMSPQGVITMTTADGTTYTANVADLIKTYTFNDTATIDFTTNTDASGNKTITAVVKNGSITADKLQPDYLADIITQAQSAQSSATNASVYAQHASADALLAQSYAVGNTGIRQDENTDNAKYYSQQSQTSASNAQTSANNAASSANSATSVYNDTVTVYNNTVNKYNDTSDIHDEVLQIKSETEQLLNNIDDEVNTIIDNAFSESVPSVYVDLTDGTLYYQSGTFNLQVDENISSPTLGELLWEVV